MTSSNKLLIQFYGQVLKNKVESHSHAHVDSTTGLGKHWVMTKDYMTSIWMKMSQCLHTPSTPRLSEMNVLVGKCAK